MQEGQKARNTKFRNPGSTGYPCDNHWVSYANWKNSTRLTIPTHTIKSLKLITGINIRALWFVVNKYLPSKIFFTKKKQYNKMCLKGKNYLKVWMKVSTGKNWNDLDGIHVLVLENL